METLFGAGWVTDLAGAGVMAADPLRRSSWILKALHAPEVWLLLDEEFSKRCLPVLPISLSC